MSVNYQLGDTVITKKPHPCGSDEWTIVRVGADVKIKCVKCARTVMIPIDKFEIKVKKIVKKSE